MTTLRVSEEAVTSQIFRVKGQTSRWFYPDPRMSPENCAVLRDVNLSERGTADSRSGYVKYNATILPNSEVGTGLWYGNLADGTTLKVVTTSDKAYYDDGTTRVDITGGTDFTGGEDDRFQFVFLKDQLVMNNGVDAPRTWDGDYVTPGTTANLGGIPFTKATGMLVHKNLLLAYGTTESGTFYPTRIRWCDIERRTYTVDITKWPTANRYEVYDGGPKIVGAVDAWGKCLTLKEDGLYPGEIVFDQLGHYDFQLDKPQRGFSPVSKMSIVSRPEFIAGAATEGIFVIHPDLSYDIVNTDDVNTWLELNQARLKYCQAGIREKDHQVRLLCSGSGNGSNHNRILVWDWDTNDVWLDRPSQALNYWWNEFEDGVEYDWYAGTNGYLYKGNASSYTDDDGTGFEWNIKMNPNDLGLPGKQKHVLNVVTYYRYKLDAQTASLQLHLDEDRQSVLPSTLDIGSSFQWDAGVQWDAGNKWPGEGVLRADTYVNRICETVAPEWTSNSPGSIVGYHVEYIPLEP